MTLQKRTLFLETQKFRPWNFTQLILDKVNASLILDDFKGETS